jgi:hypothetical protein
MYADLGHISPVSVRTEPGTNRLLLTADPSRDYCGRAHCRAQQSCHRYALIAGNSSGFHQISDPLSGWTVGVAVAVVPATFVSGLIQCSTAAVPVAPGRARPKARRLIARARHDSLGCSQAPRPASRRRSSTRTAVDPLPSATSRSNSDRRPFFRHPMQVRSGRFPVESIATVIFLTFISAGPGNALRCLSGRGILKAHVCRPLGAAFSILAPPGRSARNRNAVPARPPGARLPNFRGEPLRRTRYRCASPSAWPPGGRSGPPCQWPGKAGSREPPPGRSGWLHR